MERKRSKLKVIRRIAMIFCALVAVFCAVYLIRYLVVAQRQSRTSRDTAMQYVVTASIAHEENTDGESGEKAEEAAADAGGEESAEGGDASNADDLSEVVVADVEALHQESPYVVGWIQVSGLDVIDYPVVQYGNNSFFLTHSWDGTYSGYGSIFMDADCAADFSDPYTILYGHNMRNGSMFGSLKKYKDESFYQENGGIVTICLSGETRTYQIFSVHVVSSRDAGVYATGFAYGDDYEAYLQAMADKSLYDTGVEVSGNDSVITLSTCSGDDRLVLHAKLVRTVRFT